jgi:hypothetical protein
MATVVAHQQEMYQPDSNNSFLLPSFFSPATRNPQPASIPLLQQKLFSSETFNKRRAEQHYSYVNTGLYIF